MSQNLVITEITNEICDYAQGEFDVELDSTIILKILNKHLKLYDNNMSKIQQIDNLNNYFKKVIEILKD